MPCLVAIDWLGVINLRALRGCSESLRCRAPCGDEGVILDELALTRGFEQVDDRGGAR